MFYEEWDDESSALLLACDDEIQAICKALPGFGLEYVVSERDFYSADTAEDLTAAITSEQSLKGLATPSVRAESASVRERGLSGLRTRRKQKNEAVEAHMRRRSGWRERLAGRRRSYSDEQNGLIPDLHSRYFTADFPYGLAVIQQIGQIAGVPMPNIDSLMDWYDSIAIINDRISLTDYGITDMESLREFYLR